jgi:hypothetical protein
VALKFDPLVVTNGLKVPLMPPVALRMVYCLTALDPAARLTLTLAPPRVANARHIGTVGGGTRDLDH